MITKEVTGGTVTFRSERGEISARRTRPIELLGQRIGKVQGALFKAARIYVDGDLIDDRSEIRNEDNELVYDGPDVHLSERQVELLSRLNDATAWALIKDWTLVDDGGQPLPLPERPDDLLDLPAETYADVRREAAIINIDMAAAAGFTVDEAMESIDPDGGDGPDTSLPTSA